MKPIITLSLFVGLLWTTGAGAQGSDIQLLQKIVFLKAAEKQEMHPHVENVSHKSLRLPGRLLFGFYRNVLSEQFSANCTYDLSCSRFAIHAIRRFGIIKGTLLSADRLTRCDGFASEYVVPIFYNKKTGLIIDEPQMY